MLRGLIWFALVLMAAYVLVVVALYVGQRRLMYFPDPTPISPEDYGFSDFQVLSTRTEDGLELKFWHREGRTGFPTIALFHGNGGNVAHWADRVDDLTGLGYGVVLVEYRGYGGNPGSPTEQGLYLDARATLATMAARGVPASRVILFGESLGTGVAVQMALEGRGIALALAAPYTSVAEAAGYHYPWLPTNYLVKDRYDSLSKIKSITMPVFIIHGNLDQTIPFALGMRLAEAANMPKMVRMPEAGHNGLWAHDLVRDLDVFLKGQRLVPDNTRSDTTPIKQQPK